MSWRRILYNLIYRFGTPRWDTNITPPEVVAVIEGATAVPAGRALDLGCGTGTNVLYLARHGWEAVGVDFSPVAIAQARKKAKDTPGATFVEGDVSQLSHLDIGGQFDFVLDIGCYHGLPARSRQAYAREVARVSRPGALLMIWAIGSSRRPCFRASPSCKTRKSLSALARILSWSASSMAKGVGWQTGIRCADGRGVLIRPGVSVRKKGGGAR